MLARGSPFARSHAPRSSTAAPAGRGRPGHAVAVVGFTVTGGRIAAIDLITDREKLARHESR